MADSTRTLTVVVDIKTGKTTQVLKEIEKQGNQTFTRVIKDGELVSQTMKTVEGNTAKLLPMVQRLGIAYLALSQAFRDITLLATPLIGFMAQSIRASADQTNAITKLNAALRAQGLAVESNSAAVQQYAASLQQHTTIADEVTIGIAAQIEALTKLSGQALVDATQATVQLSKATGMDYDAAAKVMAKALNGNTGALGRYGITVKGVKSQQELLNLILDKTATGMEIAEAETRTFDGAVMKLGNAWGELQEWIGGFIERNPHLISAIDGIASALFEATGALSGMSGQGESASAIMKSLAISLLQAASAAGNLFNSLNNLGTLLPAQGGMTQILTHPLGPLGGAFMRGSNGLTGIERLAGGLDIGQGQRDINNRANDIFQGSIQDSIYGLQFGTSGPNPQGGIGGGNLVQGDYGWSGGGAAKAKRGKTERQSLMDIIEGRDMIENIIGAASRLGGNYSFNAFAGRPGAAGAFGSIGAAGSIVAARARAGLLAGLGTPSISESGWDTAMNPFAGAAARIRSNQRSETVAGNIFGGITGTAAKLNPKGEFENWWETPGVGRWSGIAGGLMGGGLGGGLAAAGGAFGGPLGALAGGLIGKLFGGGGKKRPDAGMTPAQPIYTSDINLQNMMAELLNVTRVLMLRGGGVDNALGGIAASRQQAGFSRTVPQLS